MRMRKKSFVVPILLHQPKRWSLQSDVSTTFHRSSERSRIPQIGAISKYNPQGL